MCNFCWYTISIKFTRKISLCLIESCFRRRLQCNVHLGANHLTFDVLVHDVKSVFRPRVSKSMHVSVYVFLVEKTADKCKIGSFWQSELLSVQFVFEVRRIILSALTPEEFVIYMRKNTHVQQRKLLCPALKKSLWYLVEDIWSGHLFVACQIYLTGLR